MKLHLIEDVQDDEIDITPMIDCVFLLVLFFMVTSSFIEEAKVFKIALPHASETTTVARESADSISLTADGKYFFREGGGEDQAIAGPAELMQRLKDRKEPRPVIIRCDSQCEYKQFVEIKNAVKEATRNQAAETVIFEEVNVGEKK